MVSAIVKIQWGTCVYIPLEDIIKNTLKLPIDDSSSAPRVKGHATVHRHNLKDQYCVKMSLYLRKVSASVNKRKGFWKPFFDSSHLLHFCDTNPCFIWLPNDEKKWWKKQNRTSPEAFSSDSKKILIFLSSFRVSVSYVMIFRVLA